MKAQWTGEEAMRKVLVPYSRARNSAQSALPRPCASLEATPLWALRGPGGAGPGVAEAARTRIAPLLTLLVTGTTTQGGLGIGKHLLFI